MDKAIGAIPQTDHFTAESTLVGQTDALLKYTSLLQSLKVTLHELAAAMQTKGTASCGDPCKAILQQVNDLEETAHLTFRDPD